MDDSASFDSSAPPAGDQGARPAPPEPEIPDKPLLAGLYHVVQLSADRVEIVNAGRSIALNGEGFAEKVMPLLDRLDGMTPFRDIESDFPQLAGKVVKALVQRRMVTDASGLADTAESAPQRASFAFLDLASSAEASKKLLEARVLINGCGPVGAEAAVLLAKAGVGRLMLADEETLVAADIATSGVLRPDMEGQPRAKTVAGICSQISGCRAEVVELNLGRETVGEISLGVIEIGYRPDETQTLADDFLFNGVPYLPYSQDAFEAVIGPLVGPGGEPCHRCVEYRRQSHLAHLDEYLAYRRQRSETAPRADAFLAAHTAIVAGTIATEVLRALVTGLVPEEHVAVIFDLARLTLDKEEVFLIPTCEACEKAGRFAPGKQVQVTSQGPDA